MKLIYIAFTVLLLSVCSASANADFHCAVDIKRVLIYNNGRINILHSGRNDYTSICSLSGDWKGVNVTTCAMWTSMLQNIKENKGKAIFYYAGEGSCAALPTYGSAPAPVYIGDM